jgi:hypothetical protein
MFELAELAYDLIMGLIVNAAYDSIKVSVGDFFQRRKIEKRIEDSVASVVEPLLPFLSNEGISLINQEQLLRICVAELKPVVENPQMMFDSSLNGQKIFEEIYLRKDIPQYIIEENLKDVYIMLFPRIATIICKIPNIVRNWETEAWSENFKRFDEISNEIRKLFLSIDEIRTHTSTQNSEIIDSIRKIILQRTKLELDLTCFRADKPVSGPIDHFFVHPLLVNDNEGAKKVTVTSTESSLDKFVSNKKSIVIAAPGAGKSTWLKWLHREALSNWVGIAIRIELRRYSTDSLLSLNDLIKDYVGIHYASEITDDRLNNWVKNKQLLFLFDGFDEIRPSDRDAIFNWISELSIKADGCPIVLTSRPLSTNQLDELDSCWQRWSISPFDGTRIAEYIGKWYKYTPLLDDDLRIDNTKSLAKSWRNDPTIRPLTQNPLLLSTLLMVHHLDGKLPNGRSKLYQRYIDGMLGLWDDRRKVQADGIQLTPEQKIYMLRGFALHLFENETEQEDETAVITWLTSYLQRGRIDFASEDVISSLRERSGLITGPGIYSFIHKTVAEYLIADAIVQGDQLFSNGNRVDRFCLFENRNNDRWNTILFLWAGHAPVPDVINFINECLNRNEIPLAYGIIYDQHKRISQEYRLDYATKIFEYVKRLNTSNITRDMDKPTYSFMMFSINSQCRITLINEICKSTEWYNLFCFENVVLRGINHTDELCIFDYLDSVIKDNVLLLSDFDSIPAKSNGLLWIYFLNTKDDFDTWCNCLEKIKNVNNLKNLLLSALNVAIFGKFSEFKTKRNSRSFSINLSRTDINKCKKYIDKFLNLYPQYSYLITVTILSYILYEARECASETIRSSGYDNMPEGSQVSDFINNIEIDWSSYISKKKDYLLQPTGKCAPIEFGDFLFKYWNNDQSGESRFEDYGLFLLSLLPKLGKPDTIQKWLLRGDKWSTDLKYTININLGIIVSVLEKQKDIYNNLSNEIILYIKDIISTLENLPDGGLPPGKE